MRVVVDAMGSDNHPGPDVGGGVQAAREYGDEIIFVGDQETIERELENHDTSGLKLEIVHAAQQVLMTDKPGSTARQKRESSVHIGLGMLPAGEADAFVSMGNTGAILAAAVLHAPRRISGVHRPAQAAIMPHGHGKLVFADIGANADVKPEWLPQFALMASILAERVLTIESPRVALLSNGEEEGKGNQLVQEAIPLMREQPGINYIGNMEPKEALAGGTDVLIMDGFTGNVFMKTVESVARMVSELIRREITANPVNAVGGLLARSAFARVAARLDPFEIGGAPFLGVDGVVIVGHGRSNAKAVKNAIRQARLAVETGVVEAIREGVA